MHKLKKKKKNNNIKTGKSFHWFHTVLSFLIFKLQKKLYIMYM